MLKQNNMECRRRPVFRINTVLIFCLAWTKVISLHKTGPQHIREHEPSAFSYRARHTET